MDHPIQVRRPDLVIINKKKKKKKRFFYSSRPQVKIKESEKTDIYSDLARKLNKQKLRNMHVMGIAILVGVLGTFPKGLERGLQQMEIRGRIKTIQTTALLRSARILRQVLAT